MRVLLTILLLTHIILAEETEAPATPPFQPTGDALKDFEGWHLHTLRDVGRRPELQSKVHLARRSDGTIGVYASVDLKENEEWIRLPVNMMITPERILLATELEDILNPEQTHFKDEEILAFYIAYLKFCEPPTNVWRFWLDLLPERIDSVLMFTSEELERLKGSYLFERALQHRFNIRRLYERNVTELFAKFPTFFEKTFTEQQWLWSYAIVKSRLMSFRDANGKTFKTVIPLFDFVRHKDFGADKPAFGYKATNKFFHAEVVTATKAGEEISTHLGSFSNGELLFNRGYIVDNNRYDLVSFEHTLFGVDPDNSMHTQKRELIAEILARSQNALLLTMEGLSNDLIKIVRIIAAGPEDFNELGLLRSKLTDDSELMVARLFTAYVGHKLEQYPTSYETDTNLIANTAEFSKLSSAAQLATRVVQKEKLMLHLLGTYYSGVLEKAGVKDEL